MIGHLLAAKLLFLCMAFSCGKKLDYCKFNCKVGGKMEKNSACGNKCEPASNTIEEIPPDYTFRKRMLHYHNFFRNLLAGGQNTSGGNSESSNMMAMGYDMNLEFSVACWLYRAGKMQHDKCRGGRNFERVGQNLYIGNVVDPSTENGAKRVNEAWFEELVYVEGSWMDVFANSTVREQKTPKETGHFTQLVWATTTHIGCASCRLIDNGKKKWLVGCNYGPAGNQIGAPVYLRGKATSACPSGTKANKEYPNLCGEVVIPDEAKVTGIAELKELRGGATASMINNNLVKYRNTAVPGLLFIACLLNLSF